MKHTQPRWPVGSNHQLLYAGLAIIASTLALGAVAFGILVPLLLRGHSFYSGTPNEIAAATVTLATSAGLVYVLLVRIGGTSLRELGWSTRPSTIMRDLLRGIVGFFVTQTVFVLVAFQGSLPRFLQAAATFSGGQRLEAVICGLQAAFLEESLYRGYFQRGLEQRIPTWIAIAVTAALFSLKHLRFDPPALGLFFFYGLIWGVLRAYSKTLWACGAAHFLNWAVNAFL